MTKPAVPEPDEKDWTWSITTPCAECGYDPATVTHTAVPQLTRTYAARLTEALDTEHARQRPAPAVWSPLEYACHVRDVCELFDRRLHLMLTQDDPLFDNWDQDETALAERYWTQDPATVGDELTERSDTVAESFGAVRDDQWKRSGRRSNGSVFSVDTFARYFLHDLAHHASDVEVRR